MQVRPAATSGSRSSSGSGSGEAGTAAAELREATLVEAEVAVLAREADLVHAELHAEQLKRDRGSASDTQWETLCAKDLRLILREAIYLQCALGEQTGPLAVASLARIDSLFQHPNRFRRAIHRQAGL